MAGEAVLHQHQSLSAKLHPLRLISTFRYGWCFSPFVVHWGDPAAIALQKIDPAGDSRTGEVNRSGVKCLQAVGKLA